MLKIIIIGGGIAGARIAQDLSKLSNQGINIKLIDKYLDIQLEATIKSISSQLKSGIDGVYGGEDWAYKSGLLFSPSLWNYFIKPRLKAITDFCHKNDIVYINSINVLNNRPALDLKPYILYINNTNKDVCVPD